MVITVAFCSTISHQNGKDNLWKYKSKQNWNRCMKTIINTLTVKFKTCANWNTVQSKNMQRRIEYKQRVLSCYNTLNSSMEDYRLFNDEIFNNTKCALCTKWHVTTTSRYDTVFIYTLYDIMNDDVSRLPVESSQTRTCKFVCLCVLMHALLDKYASKEINEIERYRAHSVLHEIAC